jgi:hypothetical protein
VDLAVIGGGEFGSFHARQLLKAGAGRVLVVDRDPGCAAFRSLPGIEPVVEEWSAFLAGWLERAAPGDQLVPAPLAPHLLWEWLAGAAGLERCPPPRGWRLPYEVPGAGGEVFLSAAAWTCPATCVEPAHCPVLHAPRDWDLADLIARRAVELGWVPAVLRVLHFAQGVATVPVRELRGARERARALAPGERVLVATSSRCHAAVGGLRARDSG